MLREYTLHAISEMYGADTDRDGVFDVYHAPGLESKPGWESQGSEYITGIKVALPRTATNAAARSCSIWGNLSTSSSR
jgi:hypothetical protein